MTMESQWFQQQATKMINGCDHNNAGNKIDLTLKLGLPNCDENYQPPHIGQHLDIDIDQIMTPHHANVEGINHYKMVDEGMNIANNIGQNFNGNEIPWSPPKFGNKYIHPQYLHSNINNGYGFSPFSSSSNPYYHPLYSINPNNNNLLAAAATAPGVAAMNNYTLLDIPSRRVDREFIAGSSSRRKVGMRRQRGGGFIDPYKRCTNYNCNTNDTPMWRRGPLGPKTLCNACGIKYRKEEEKRKAKETDKSNSQDSNAQTA